MLPEQKTGAKQIASWSSSSGQLRRTSGGHSKATHEGASGKCKRERERAGAPSGLAHISATCRRRRRRLMRWRKRWRFLLPPLPAPATFGVVLGRAQWEHRDLCPSFRSANIHTEGARLVRMVLAAAAAGALGME